MVLRSAAFGLKGAPLKDGGMRTEYFVCLSGLGRGGGEEGKGTRGLGLISKQTAPIVFSNLTARVAEEKSIAICAN